MLTPRGLALPRPRLLLGLLALSLLRAPLASAQEAAPGPRATLSRINDDINTARQLLPTSVGGDVEAEAKALTELQAALDAAKQALTPELQADGAAHAAVASNLADAESWLTHLSLSHDCNRARQTVLSAHNAGRAAGEAPMRLMKLAVEAFTAGALAGAADDAAFYQAQLDKLSAREAELQSAGAAAATATQKADLAALAAEANAALAALQQLNSTLQPITAAAVQRLAKAAKELGEASGDAARYYQDELLHYRVEQHWALEDPASFEAIAATLGGAITVRGVNRGKRLTLKLETQVDRCYLLFMRFSEWSGAESIEEFDWGVTGSKSSLQELTIRRTTGWKGLPLRGFCATQAANITAKAKLAFDGRRNPLRYVVVEYERQSFPSALATRLEIMGVDHCDTDAWKALWLQPVPGTLSYVDGEPVVISKIDDDFATYWTTGAPRQKRALISRFATAAPEALVVGSTLQQERCPDGQAGGRIRAEISSKIQKCLSRIDKKYAPKWKKVERMRAAGDAAKADALTQKLETKVAADQEKRCAPLEGRAAEAFAAAVQELRTALPQKKPSDPTRRIEALRAYSSAPLKP